MNRFFLAITLAAAFGGAIEIPRSRHRLYCMRPRVNKQPSSPVDAFGGIQTVFKHTKGRHQLHFPDTPGGTTENPSYDQVSTAGRDDAGESVKVVFDPSRLTYGQLLKVFFSVAHDPTELNRQGPDEGTQYRSAIFFTDPEQQKVAKAYIDQLNAAKVYKHAIVTQVFFRWRHFTTPRIIIRITPSCIPTSRTSTSTICRS